LKNSSAALKTCEVIFDIPEKSHRLKEIEALISKEGFWGNPDKQREVFKERAVLSETLDKFKRLSSELEDLSILFDLALEEGDQQELIEIAGKLKTIDGEISAQEFERMLGGTDDPLDAIVSINAGAGGTEAQDWAEMLLRMYLRWSEKQNFKNQIIDLQPGEEAGIKVAVMLTAFSRRRRVFTDWCVYLHLTPAVAATPLSLQSSSTHRWKMK
jgi:peptide chain release factor 2